MDWITLVDQGLTGTPEWPKVRQDIEYAIDAVTWPPGNDTGFIINPTRKGNGVKPIKDGFIKYLEMEGWIAEVDFIDAHFTFPSGQLQPFGVEWETGNISSSHRAINRLARGMLEGRLSGGVLVLPSAELYKYLTDRVGNVRELAPYFDLYRLWESHPEIGYLGVVVVEHHGTDPSVPLIAKGTDGRALL
ncbi:MAG: PDDEXK family nuclease [Dermatophilaceae bacterium]